MTNRLSRLAAVVEAAELGEQAALHNEPANPYPVGGYLFAVWQDAFNRTLERLAKEESK